MSAFFSKALRRAEVFLEQVDESVAQASRRLVVEGATGEVDEHDDISSEDESSQTTRASSIPRAERRAAVSNVGNDDSEIEEHTEEAWGGDIILPDAKLQSTDGTAGHEDSQDHDSGSSLPEATADENSINGVETIQTPPDPKEDEDRPTMDIKNSISASMDNAVNQEGSDSKTAPTLATGKSTHSTQEGSPAEYDKYVEALKSETADLRKELDLVEADFEKARREKSKMVKNLKRMKDIVTEMDESLQEKSSEARRLEEELVVAKERISTLRTESRENDARGKDNLDILRKELNTQVDSLDDELDAAMSHNSSLQKENERLREALLKGHEVEAATADGARHEASQAHHAYEAESQAHRETRQKAKEREEALEAEAALAATALASAQRKADESTQATSQAKSAQRSAESKLATVTSARNVAFARITDLEDSLRMYEHADGDEAPGQKEAQAMTQTLADLENALETKNVELNRLEGEVEALRASSKSTRHSMSPRSPGPPGRPDGSYHQEAEVKLRHMADAALRKQAQLEVLRSENRALQHQLTTERKRTREAQAMAAAASSSRQSIRGGFRGILDTGEDERGDRAYGVRDGPLARFRTPRSWPRTASRIVTGMDRFSAQALAFLRKEPLLRIVILLYLAAMHIFVYSLLRWHVASVSGSVDTPHASIASASSGGQMRAAK